MDRDIDTESQKNHREDLGLQMGIAKATLHAP